MFSVFFLLYLLISVSGNPLVTIPLGSVVGYFGTSFNGRTYSAFEGIPYARSVRFEEPEPIEPWNGVWNATVGTTCAQILMTTPQTTIGQEDCLHVNVYVPREDIDPEERLEVVVHIHGDIFSFGSGTAYTNPQFVMDKEVIFVTFNYRLGIFGFLSTEDEVVPGNNGLKDQVLALKWIQNNIRSFGGNPESVTLTGFSAGAISVHLHYFSELSRGLFHRGFAQSGVALNPWAIVEGSLEKAKKLADAVECPSEGNKNMVECLKTAPAERILHTVDLFYGYKFVPIDPFGPVIEKGGANPFLAEYPYRLLETGQLQDLPLIISTAEKEGSFLVSQYNEEDFTTFNQSWDKVTPFLFDFNYTLPESEWFNVSDKLRHWFFGDLNITYDRAYMMIDPITQRYFLYDTETVMRLQSNVTSSPVYYYRIVYSGESYPLKDAEHGAEIKYMYGNLDSTPLTENELKMKDLLWDMVVSYARTGIPSFGDVEWEPTTPQEHVYLFIFGTESGDNNLWTAKEFTNNDFWKSMNFAENENLFPSNNH